MVKSAAGRFTLIHFRKQDDNGKQISGRPGVRLTANSV